MKAIALLEPGQARVIEASDPRHTAGHLLFKVEMVVLYGSDLNSFRGRNALPDEVREVIRMLEAGRRPGGRGCFCSCRHGRGTGDA